VDTGILTVDLKGAVKSFNRAAEAITDFKYEDARGKRIEEFFPGISPHLSLARDAKRKKERTSRFEIDYNKGGDQRTIGFALSPLIDAKGSQIGNIMIFQDLTSLKEMEREIERNKRLAIIGEMTACFAHEIRNPLASLSGSVQMLRRDLKLNETEDRLMQIILRGKDQLESLLKDFLLLAKPGVDQREMVDMSEVVNDVIDSLRCDGSWNNNIEVVAHHDAPGIVFGNRAEIRQAAWNLVLNASQAMPGGGRLEIKTTPKSEKGREYIACEISDEGCGIEEIDVTKIFEPFYTTKEKGTGLGLAIVRRIAESHGGRVHVEEKVGRGSRFVLLLPRDSG
jgi:two-component system sensor histidine kinase PilS (NtrC family)